MTPVIWALAVGATFFGGLLSTVSGLGGGVLLLPILTFALGVWLIGYAALAAWRRLKNATAGDASRTARQRFPEAAAGEPGRAGFETRGHRKLIAYGAVTGVMSGALGVGGGTTVTGLRDYGLSKQTLIATVGVVSIAMQLTKIPVYVGSNTLPRSLLPLAAALAGVAVLSTRMGTYLLAKMSADIFDTILLVVLFAFGITMVVR